MYDLSDLIRAKGCGCAKPCTMPKQKCKPKNQKSKKDLKSEKRKKTKPDNVNIEKMENIDEQKDNIENEKQEDADAKNTTLDIEIVQQKTETENVEDQKDPPIKSDKDTETD